MPTKVIALLLVQSDVSFQPKMADLLMRLALCLVLLQSVGAESSKCGHPGQPDNVIISEPNEAVDLQWFPIGTELTFACLNPSDKLRGDIKRICLDDGSWTDSSPWCESNFIADKLVRGQDEDIYILTDGLIPMEDDDVPVDCLDTSTEGQRTFKLPIGDIDSISLIVVHIEDSLDNMGIMAIRLDEQDIKCEPSSLTVFECPIEFEHNLFLGEGLLTINSPSPSLSLCELEVYSRLTEFHLRKVPVGMSNRSFDFDDEIFAGFDPDTAPSTENEDTQEIVMIIIGLTLGAAVVSVVLAKVYSAYCGKKADPTKDYYTQVPTIVVNGKTTLDPQFIQHLHNPKLSI